MRLLCIFLIFAILANVGCIGGDQTAVEEVDPSEYQEAGDSAEMESPHLKTSPEATAVPKNSTGG